MKNAMVLLVTLVTTTNVLVACGNSSKDNKVSKSKIEQSSKSKKKMSSKKQKESSSQETSEASVNSSSSVQVSQSQIDSNDQETSQSTSESDQHAAYSIVGVWQDKRESSSKLTFKADGSFEKYSAAAGFKTTGTYQIVSQQDDNVTVSMSLKYPNGQTEEQNAQYKFTNENILVAGNQQYERSN